MYKKIKQINKPYILRSNQSVIKSTFFTPLLIYTNSPSSPPLNLSKPYIHPLPLPQSSSLLPHRIPHLPKPNPHAPVRTQHDLRLELHIAILPVSVDPLVFLEHADDRVADLGEGELLPDADPGAAVEGDVLRR